MLSVERSITSCGSVHLYALLGESSEDGTIFEFYGFLAGQPPKAFLLSKGHYKKLLLVHLINAARVCVVKK